MFRAATAVLLVLAAAVGPAGEAAADPAPLAIAVSGTSVALYPAFDPNITRYGVQTGSNTGGTLDVTATGAGTITVGDAAATSGQPVHLTGLAAGDETTVEFADSGTETFYTLVYLPPEFQNMTVTGTPQPGNVALTLGSFAGGQGYETLLDGYGVPTYLRALTGSADFKAVDSPEAKYSVLRRVPDGTGYRLDLLDGAFDTVRSVHTTAAIGSTDSHESLLLPDGSTYLVAYVARADGQGGHWIDAVIQQVARDGTALFSWNSFTDGGIDPANGLATRSPADYAHINSVDLFPDGDLLVSFRNQSQVIRVARAAHDGYLPGQVVWRLGGVSNQFAIKDSNGAPDGGPCAQHSARVLPSGHLLIFDNGSQAEPGNNTALGLQTADMCANPNDPTGPRIARPYTRIDEYALDTTGMTATLVWSYDAGHSRYARFAGGVQQLANGHRLIGWSEASPDVSEVDANGNELWALDVPAGGQFSYRAWKVPGDTTPPAIDVAAPVDGAVFAPQATATAHFSCSDRGGSSLHLCTGPQATGTALDTSTTGAHQFSVSAADGDGNVRTVVHTYYVGTAPTAPAGLTATAGRQSVTLRWAAAQGGGLPVTGYDVQEALGSGAWHTVATTSARHVTRTNRMAGRTYRYRVRARNRAGASPYGVAVAAVPYTAPGAPTGLVLTPRRGALDLRWSAPPTNGWTPVTGYVVQYARCRIGSGRCAVHTRAVTGRSLRLSPLSRNSRYHVRVAARNRAGQGAFTTQASARPK